MVTPRTNKRIAEIVQAAFRCVGENGYDKLTMQEIARYANMSKGAINHYFKRKDDVLIAVFEELDHKLYDTVDKKIQDPESPEEMLRYRLSGSFEMTREDSTLMHILMDFAALSKNNSKYGDFIRHFFQKYRYLSSAGVRSGAESGLYRKDEINEMGVIIVAVIIGIGIQWVLEERAFDYDKVAKIAEEMIVMYLENGKNIS